MESLIFDTSVWVDFSRKKETHHAQLLKEYLQNNGPIFICPPIYQEIIQGAKEPLKIIELLDSLSFLELDSYFVAKEAALIFQTLRQNGITIRKPNDCIIAYYAIHFNLKLVHNDIDFDQIAQKTKLKIY